MAKTTEQLVIEIRAQADAALEDMKRLEKMATELEEGVDIDVNIEGAGARVAQDLIEQAERMQTELDQAKVAAERLGQALGPELTSRINMDATLGEFKLLGLSMDDVSTDADELAAAIKAIDDVKVSAESSGLTSFGEVGSKAKAGLDGVRDSADQSRSVLANMVGNSAQDLGALGGVAGSAGVAIGQLAEYAADGNIKLSNLAMTIGPLVGIGVAVQGITQHFKSLADAKAFDTKQVEQFQDAIQDTGDDVENLVRKLRAARDIESVGPGWLGGGDDFEEILTSQGLKVEDWARLVAGSQKDLEAWRDSQKAAGFDVEDTAKVVIQAEEAHENYAVAVANDAIANELFGTSSEAATDATSFFDKAVEGTIGTVEDATEAQKEHREELEAAAIASAKAAQALEQLASPFERMSIDQQSLGALFELGNAPEVAAGKVRDISLAIGDLSEDLKGIKVADVLSGSIKADEFLDAIDALAPQIQASITDTFAASGPEAATAMANSYIDQVTAELGGKFTREQVAALLGLEDIEAVIGVAVAQSDIEKARRQLAILTGIGGETPLTASIALALDAGTITGAQALALIQAALGAEGVEVPAALAVPTTDEALAAAQAALEGTPVSVPTTTDPAGFTAGVAELTEADYDPTLLPVGADPKSAETTIEETRKKKRETTPIVVTVDNAKAANDLLTFISQPRSTIIYVGTSGIPQVDAALDAVASSRRAPIEAYLADYPSASEIQAAIGRPRVAVDLVVGQTFRITGVRDG